MALNEELVANAVTFLKDPQVSSSSLEKKAEFLESKGLSKEEIEEAIRRSQDPNHSQPQGTETPTTSVLPQPLNSPQPSYQQHFYAPAPPPVPEKDWKDYFIMATATVGVGFALYEIAKRYLIPNILPESKSKLDKDKDAIEEEFLRIEATLNEISDTQKELKENEKAKSKVIDETIEAVQDLIHDSKDKNSKVEDDVKYLKSEIENLKTSFDRSLDKQQQSISSEVANIQHELNSLQQLIKSKNTLSSEFQANGIANNAKSSPVPPASSIPSASEILKRANLKTQSSPAVEDTKSNESTTISSPIPQVKTPPQTAQIPAWQRAAASSSSENENTNLLVPERPDSVQMNHQSYSQSTAVIPSWQKAVNDPITDAYKEEILSQQDEISGTYIPRDKVDIPQDQKFRPVSQ
jgi:peroxin-14